MKTSSIFVELDTLLDTRMATLFKLSPDSVENIIKLGYHDRPFDIFPGIDEVKFRDAYSKRDKSILATSVVTPVAQIVKEFVVRTLDNVNNSPFHYQPKVILNIHPYKLDENEINMLIATLRHLTLNLADIEVVDMSYEEISPLYVKLNLSIMILYQYDLWLEAQSVNEAFKKHTAPDVTLIGPRIYFKKPESRPKADEDPFAAMEHLASPFIGLALLPVEKFSMVINPIKKKTTT